MRIHAWRRCRLRGRRCLSRSFNVMSSSPHLADVMIALCANVGPTKTIDPGDVAKAYAETVDRPDVAWQNYLQGVRNTAVSLAKEGRIVIYRKGKPADPDTFRGVYRLGAPNIS
jgi:hypothetical protein